MKAIILDGSRDGEETGERGRKALLAQLALAGWEVEHVLLREKKIGSCAGDFFCWIRNPGVCHVGDDNRGIAEAMMKSDLLVFFTPITFGGYSSHLKSMVDHLIQNISPYFTTVNGETHHQWRYQKYPSFLAAGYIDLPDARSEQIFRRLAWRNSINLCPDSSEAITLCGTHTDAEMEANVRQGLQVVAAGHRLQAVDLPIVQPVSPQAANAVARPEASKKAVLIVGSPRTRSSSSFALGQFVLEELEPKGFTSEIHFTHTSLRSAERMQAIYDGVDSADIVVFAFPLYVDSIPAPAIEVLERIAAHRSSLRKLEGPSSRAGAARFVGIANCGFPESQQNLTALAICDEFARQAGLIPAGGLALGGGEPLVQGKRLRDAHGPVDRVKKALVAAAADLAVGLPVPDSAVALLARPFIPTWMYRLIGGVSWKIQARKYGMKKELRRQPYAKA